LTVIQRRQERNGTAAAWTAANPVLAAAELGVESDTLKFKIGDGTTAWAALPYKDGAVTSVDGQVGGVALNATYVPITGDKTVTGVKDYTTLGGLKYKGQPVVRVNEGPLSVLDPRVAMVGDSATDNAAAWATAMTLLPPGAAGELFFPPGNYKTLSPLVVTPSSTHQLKLSGVGLDSIITGTGFTVLNFSGFNGPILQDLMVRDPVGHASTILVNLDNGPYPTGGMNNFELRNVTLRGNASLASGARLGVGLRCKFALKGLVSSGAIEYLNDGCLLTDAANAIGFIAARIRSNNRGLFADNAGEVITNVHFGPGTVVENNQIGVESYATLLSCEGAYFENTVREVKIQSGGELHSTNSYYGGNGTHQIEVVGGTGGHSSSHDVLNNGSSGAAILHNGTGYFLVRQPKAGGVSLGTGPVVTDAGLGETGRNTAGNNYSLDGYNAVVLGQPIIGKAGTDTRISLPVGRVTRFTDSTGATMGYFDPVGLTFYLAATYKARFDGDLDQRGANVTLFNKVVSQGAIDSGGVGFRVLRVPN